MDNKISDLRTAELRKYEWETLTFYVNKWIDHVKEKDSENMTDEEEDHYIYEFNDIVRLKAICEKILEQIT